MARRPHDYYSPMVGIPRGYTRRFNFLLSLTVLSSIVTAIVGIDSIWTLIVTFILLIFTMLVYLVDVKGNPGRL